MGRTARSRTRAPLAAAALLSVALAAASFTAPRDASAGGVVTASEAALAAEADAGNSPDERTAEATGFLGFHDEVAASDAKDEGGAQVADAVATAEQSTFLTFSSLDPDELVIDSRASVAALANASSPELASFGRGHASLSIVFVLDERHAFSLAGGIEASASGTAGEAHFASARFALTRVSDESVAVEEIAGGHGDGAGPPAASLERTGLLGPGAYALDAILELSADDPGAQSASASAAWTFELSLEPNSCDPPIEGAITGSEDDDDLRSHATDGDDVVCGYGGNDLIDGRGGNDRIFGGAGDDTIDGGDGDDRIRAGDGADLVDGGRGFDVVRGEEGDDTICGGTTAEDGRCDGELSTSENDDVLYGGPGADHVVGGHGNDAVFGGPDNAPADVDVLRGGCGDDIVASDEGEDAAGDLIEGGNGNDVIAGGNGADRICGDTFGPGSHPEADLNTSCIRVSCPRKRTREQDYVVAGKNPPGTFDVVQGGPGHDHLDGGDGDDELYGERGDDLVLGGDGDDRLFGGRGSDKLRGQLGADLLRGDFASARVKRKDVLSGGKGDDGIEAADGVRDVVRGGRGTDQAQVDAGVDAIDGIEEIAP